MTLCPRIRHFILDDASLLLSVPWTMRPFYSPSLGRCVHERNVPTLDRIHAVDIQLLAENKALESESNLSRHKSVPSSVRDGSYGNISSRGHIFQEPSRNKLSGTHRPRCTVNNFALKYFLKGHQGLPECTTRQTVTWTS